MKNLCVDHGLIHSDTHTVACFFPTIDTGLNLFEVRQMPKMPACGVRTSTELLHSLDSEVINRTEGSTWEHSFTLHVQQIAYIKIARSKRTRSDVMLRDPCTSPPRAILLKGFGVWSFESSLGVWQKLVQAMEKMMSTRKGLSPTLAAAVAETI